MNIVFLYAFSFFKILLRMALLTATFIYRFLTLDLTGWVQMEQRYEHGINCSFLFSFPSACLVFYNRYIFFYNIVIAGTLYILGINFF